MTRWMILIIIILLMITLFWVQTKSKSDTITIGFAGDTMLGRSVDKKLIQLDEITRMRYPWGNVIDTTRAVDLMMVNLETTLTHSTDIVEKVFNFKATPSLINTLIQAGVDVVSLANNHSLDFGVSGLQETIATLDSAAIHHVGAGNTLREAQKPVIIEKSGIKIGILGFTDNEPGWKAGDESPGINYIEVGDKSIQPLIKQLRDKVDIVITSLHWGPNMRQRPTQDYIDYAHFLIDSGVDIIHGHSAHIVQGIEIYKGKVIMYDTGDFVDDYAIDPVLRNDLSCMFMIDVDKNGPIKIKLLPTVIKNMQVNFATADDYEFIVKRMRTLCAEFGTPLSNNNTIMVR